MMILLDYLVIGVFVMVMFDIITKRIRSKLSSRVMMLQSQTGFGYKTSIVLIVFGLIVFWPAVIVGMFANNGGNSDADNPS